jgi:hypothetical protein
MIRHAFSQAGVLALGAALALIPAQIALAVTVPGGGGPNPGTVKNACSAPTVPAVGQAGTLALGTFNVGAVTVASVAPQTSFSLGSGATPPHGTRSNATPDATFTATLGTCQIQWIYIRPTISTTGTSAITFTHYDTVSHVATVTAAGATATATPGATSGGPPSP